MPKFKLLVDVDSVVDEAEHLEEIFKDGFDCSEEEAERIVSSQDQGIDVWWTLLFNREER